MNINALQTISSLLKSKYDVSFLLTSHLNQNSLEIYFLSSEVVEDTETTLMLFTFSQHSNMFVPSTTANCRRNDGKGDCVLSVDDFLVGSPLVITAQRSNAPCLYLS